MNPSISLRGVIVPLVTPFDEQNQLDLAGVQRVCEFVLSKGVQSVMAGGTTGEGMLMSLGERKALLECILSTVQGRVPVIAHVGCIDTGSTLELARHARQAGADILSAIVPYFFTFTDEQIYRHFMALSQAVPDLPLLLYVFPGNAKNDISPVLLERLVKAAPNIVGIKSSNPDLVRYQEYMQAGGEGFATYFGPDNLMLAGLALGGWGQISGNANAYPEVYVKLYEAFQRNDLAEAQRLQILAKQVADLHRSGRNPAFLKASLNLRGVEAGKVRPPFDELSPGEWDELKMGILSILI
jgi:dihydrodipicolinate synthase/N-acetylneuraminate lyase